MFGYVWYSFKSSARTFDARDPVDLLMVIAGLVVALALFWMFLTGLWAPLFFVAVLFCVVLRMWIEYHALLAAEDVMELTEVGRNYLERFPE